MCSLWVYNEQMNQKHSAKAHAVALGLVFLIIIALSTVWVFHLKAGPRLDAWTGAVTVLYVPAVLILFGVGWLSIRFALVRFVQLSAWNVLGASLLAAFLFITVTCGPFACFALSASQRGMGFFLLAGAALIALSHQYILVRIDRAQKPHV